MAVHTLTPSELRNEIVNQIEWCGLYLLEHAEDFVPTEDSGAIIVGDSLYLSIGINPLEQPPTISTGIDYLVPTQVARPNPLCHGHGVQTRGRRDG